MEMAIAIALRGKLDLNGGSFGAVIVKDNKVVVAYYNEVKKQVDTTQHAELRCIQIACKALASKDLSGCVLYTSCEPCSMCISACGFARINEIYFGASVTVAEQYGYALSGNSRTALSIFWSAAKT